MKYVKLEDGKEPGELTAVRQAVSICLSSLHDDQYNGSVDIDYHLKSDEVLVTLADGRILPFKMLSDGYRNMIGMIADIAFRMAVLNPQLEEKTALETPGVVLIDEIDLHLHPKWQRTIVDDLKRTFPKIQFVVTTHSPFIIQSLKDGELRILDEMSYAIGEYADKSIEDVTENVMGVELPQWSDRKRKMYEAAEKYYAALHRQEDLTPEELDELRRELDKLTKPFEDNVAFTAFLEQERLLMEAHVARRKEQKE